ncbi:MAG: putative ABC transporter-binding protein [Anaerolineales bacterium]|nr:putative ABC transporter-binding protein [Anaerolineales bacterium]
MVFDKRILRFGLLMVLIIAALLAIIGCAAPAPVPQESTGAGTGEQEAAAEISPEMQAELEKFDLQPGKPYEGTELNFLICCATAAQFHALAEKSNTEFYELTGIKVQWGDVPYGSFQEKLVTEATSASDTYDLFAFTDAWGAGLKPYMIPISDKVEGVDHIALSDYPEAYVQASRGLDGELYGLPLRGHPFMFFYREDVFEDLGLEVPTTWAEMEEAAEVIKAETDMYPLSVYYGINAGQNTFWWEALLWSNGGDLFDENWKPIFNNEAGVEATERYISWLEKEYTSPGSVSFNEQEGNEEFIQGRAAMFMGWWWMYSRMTDCERGAEGVCENTGFATAPSWEGKGQPRTYGHVWPMGINEFSNNKEAAWEYMKWIHSAEVQKEIVMDKSAPEVSTNVATRISVLNDPEVNEVNNGLPKVGGEILEEARTNPIIPEWLEILGILEVGINDMATGAEIQPTLDQMAADVEEIMERGGYYDK